MNKAYIICVYMCVPTKMQLGGLNREMSLEPTLTGEKSLKTFRTRKTFDTGNKGIATKVKGIFKTEEWYVWLGSGPRKKNNNNASVIGK